MAKAKPKLDQEREDRITMEIVVDAFGPEEQAMGWYSYLDDQLKFPFTATCTLRRATSPLQVKDEVEVIGMAGEDECGHEMTIRWAKDGLAVPLVQLTPGRATDKQTRQAVADWHYWAGRGYTFG